MKPLVYVADPYTRPDPVENTHRAITAGMELWETGKCGVIVPHVSLLMHAIHPRALGYWYEFDIDQVAHCSAVWRLPGESTGADREVAYAIERGIPTFTDRRALMEWLGEPSRTTTGTWLSRSRGAGCRMRDLSVGRSETWRRDGWRLAHTTAEASMRDRVLHETVEGVHVEDGITAVNHHFAVAAGGGRISRLYVEADSK